ncbi:MAG: spore germination protein GerW family protein [Oscillospiraceae bacterium]
MNLSKIKEMVYVNTIVGDTITTPDGTTLIPISKVSFGFGGGGSDIPYKNGGFGGGNGAGVKIEPVGFLVVCEGNVKMLNIGVPPTSTLDRLVELIPDFVDKIEQLIKDHKHNAD